MSPLRILSVALCLCAFALNSGSAQSLISDLQVQRSLRVGTATAGVITPAQITATQDDYAPTGFSSAFAVRLDADAARSITGLAGGAGGRMVLLANVGSFAITLENEDAGSTAANRFALTGDYALEPGGTCLLYYDSTSSRWRQPGGGGGGATAWGEIPGTLSDQTDLQTALDAKVDEGAVTSSGLTMATARLLGRTTASTGAIEEITVGTGLSLTGGELSATASAPAWGEITGTLADQTDLDTALDGKASTGAITTSGLTMATARIIGRTTASTGAPEEITIGTGLTLSAGELSADGGGGGAPTDATYITQTANGTLSAEQALSSLSTGIMRVATSTGVITSLTDSAGIAANISDETGSGALVFGTNPTISSLAFSTNAITGSGATTISAGGSDQNLILQASGTGDIVLNSSSSAVDLVLASTSGAANIRLQRSGTVRAMWGISQGTDNIVNGSALDDAVFRSDASRSILFSTDAGTSVAVEFVASTGQLNARKNIASTSTTTGSIITAGGIGVAGRTSTATLNVGTGTTLSRLLSGTNTLDFPSISAGATETLTITVTGAATGDSVSLGLPSSPAAGIVFQGYVSGTNTVTVSATNITGSPVDPSSATYRATVMGF